MGILPTNPDFQKLTYSQIQWLCENIRLDYQMEADAYKKAMSETSSDPNDITQEIDIDTDDLIQQAKIRHEQLNRR